MIDATGNPIHIGDVVRITHSGAIYPIYFRGGMHVDESKKLNLRKWKDGNMPEEGEMFRVVEDIDDVHILIESNDYQYLIGSRGITLINNYKPCHTPIIESQLKSGFTEEE